MAVERKYVVMGRPLTQEGFRLARRAYGLARTLGTADVAAKLGIDKVQAGELIAVGQRLAEHKTDSREG